MKEKPALVSIVDDGVGTGGGGSKTIVKTTKNKVFSLVDDPRYKLEIPDYPKEKPFHAKKMISDGIITKTRYNVNELDKLLKNFVEKGIGKTVNGKQGEIIFVMKQNGEMVFSMRRADDYLPHPVLSSGEDILSAGTIKRLDSGVIEITRKSGHFHPDLESLDIVKESLDKKGYKVIINPAI